MSKKSLILFLCFSAVLLLTACNSDSSWDEEEVVESKRIMTDDVKVEWELDERQAPGDDHLIRMTVANNGDPIEEFEVTHEKLLHLIVVSKDLSYFNHIHPEYKGNGVFEVENHFPAGGEYRMIADFKPKDGDSMSKMEWVTVEGEAAQLSPVSVDHRLEKIIEGINVSLTVNSGLEAGKELTLEFRLTEGDLKDPITDLEPYLGSIGHVVVLSEDSERYLHVHALENQGSGPVALFETTFPQPGVYKIWAQFQRNGNILTVPFVVDVP
ncbi:hypothetical protein [Metabacillus litoralis]|uniref:hypothetical protein n=1 Tax=Metabacillus litoralis TaxID=152268 RepID=UPI000EF625FF|nr:hypothetical protein [Metabacillus litoralis]